MKSCKNGDEKSRNNCHQCQVERGVKYQKKKEKKIQEKGGDILQRWIQIFKIESKKNQAKKRVTKPERKKQLFKLVCVDHESPVDK